MCATVSSPFSSFVSTRRGIVSKFLRQSLCRCSRRIRSRQDAVKDGLSADGDALTCDNLRPKLVTFFFLVCVCLSVCVVRLGAVRIVGRCEHTRREYATLAMRPSALERRLITDAQLSLLV